MGVEFPGDDNAAAAQNALTSQMLFQSISKVGAVLLHLGDMGKKIKEESNQGGSKESAEGGNQPLINDIEASSLKENTAVNDEIVEGASCGQESAAGAAEDAANGNEDASNASGDWTIIGASGDDAAATKVSNTTSDLRIIGDWYRDELELSKMSSTANKSLNKLVDSKGEKELSDTLLLLATANDIDSLKLSDETNIVDAAMTAASFGVSSDAVGNDAPNRTNDNHLVIDKNKEIVSFHSSPGEMVGWTVSFEQILASILADPRLAKFFEKETNLLAKMAEFQSRKVTESFSSFQNFGTTPTT